MSGRALAIALVPLVATIALARDRGDPPPLAIENAKVVVAPGKVLDRATIVFRNGRVEAVGKSVTPPPDALIEDGRGLVVYPGFIDAGCPFPIEAAAPEAAKAKEGAQPNLQEDPPIATPEARRKGIRAALDLASSALIEGDRRTAEKRAGFAVALAVPPQGILAGKSALFALGDSPRRTSVLAAPLFLHAGFWSRDQERGYPHTLMGAHAHLRQAFADATRQSELRRRAARGAPGPRPAFDPELDALVPVLEGKLRVAFAADDEVDVERVLELSRELGFKVVITGGRRAAKAAPVLRREGIPVIAELGFGPKPKPATRDGEPDPKPRKGRSGKPLQGPFWLGGLPMSLPPPDVGPAEEKDKPRRPRRGLRGGRGDENIDPTQEPTAAFRERERKHKETVANLRDLFLAGVRVAVASQGVSSPGELRERLREAIQAGLPEEAAVAILTRDAASILGVPRLGTLEPGSLAFATVLTGSLAEEKARVRFLVVDGEKQDGERLEDDARLARLAGRWRWDTGTSQGTLVIDAAHGKLSGRVQSERSPEVALASITLEGDRVRFAFPREAIAQPPEAPEPKVDVRWLEPDVLEGTATFHDGPRAFRAEREPK